MAVAVTAMLTACEKTEIVSNGEAQEISFVAVNKVATKVPVDGTTFDQYDNMQVAAYIISGPVDNGKGNFFDKTKFSKSGNTWVGDPARYWPLTTSTINFLAVTETGGRVNNTEVTFDDTNYASGALVILSGNASLNQNDLMYAAGQQTHTQGSAYEAVPMIFKHALSWINFTVKTTNSTDKVTIVVNSIKLNEASYNGTLTLTNNNYNYNLSSSTTDDVTAKWSDYNVTNSVVVPNENGTDSAPALLLTNNAQLFGNGLLVVPDGYAKSFTINYTLAQGDGTANTYDYTYELPEFETSPWEMAKKYFYNINITLSEIEITPSITDWDVTSTSKDVELNGNADTQVDTPANN